MTNKAPVMNHFLAVTERSGRTWSEMWTETGLNNLYGAQLFGEQALLKPQAIDALRSELPELRHDLIGNTTKPPLRTTYSHFDRSFDGDSGLSMELRGLKVSRETKKAISIMCSREYLPNANKCASFLQECVDVKDLKTGKCIHGHMITIGFVPDQYLQTKILIMYCKNVDMYSAHQVFDRMHERNLVAWNGMMSLYVESGRYEEAFRFYSSMLSVGVMPDQFTFASLFKACAGLAKLELGRRVHGELIKSRIVGNVIVNSAVVDMYCKCSSVSDARHVFESLPLRNVVTWTSLISGYGQHGDVDEVLQLFHRMIDEGLRPNHITFLVVLCACSHAGLDAAAWKYFNLMTCDYGMNPKAEHCAAMVDLLARSGRLDEAHEFVKLLPFEQHSVLWGTLLGASRVHGHLELAKLASDKFFELEPDNAGKYVVLSNVYAASGLWRKVAEVRKVMKENGIQKEPACSWIEVQREVHSFLVRDKLHPRTPEIYGTIKSLVMVLKDAGYTPDIIDS